MQATKARSAFAERAFRVFEEECEVSLAAELRNGDFAVVGERKAGRRLLNELELGDLLSVCAASSVFRVKKRSCM